MLVPAAPVRSSRPSPAQAGVFQVQVALDVSQHLVVDLAFVSQPDQGGSFSGHRFARRWSRADGAPATGDWPSALGFRRRIDAGSIEPDDLVEGRCQVSTLRRQSARCGSAPPVPLAGGRSVPRAQRSPRWRGRASGFSEGRLTPWTTRVKRMTQKTRKISRLRPANGVPS